MKKIFGIFILMCCTLLLTGCGEIPESLREDEKNYMQMIEKRFEGVDYTIISDKTVKSTFAYEWQSNEVDVHIIDAVLKDDPNFKFRICTGFSERPTFTVVYDSETNYENLIRHNIFTKIVQNSKHISLKSGMYTINSYSKECAIDYYENTLIFNENSSVEEIAKELASYGDFGIYHIDYEYGDIIDYITIYDKNNITYDNYVDLINIAIKRYNNSKNS